MSKKSTRQNCGKNAVMDQELTTPSQMTVSKRRKLSRGSNFDVNTVTNATNVNTQHTSQHIEHKCGPLSAIFEKIQQNENIHSKYLHELYGKVSIFLIYRNVYNDLNKFSNKLGISFCM